MDVEDGLTGGFAGIDHHAVALVCQLQLARELRRAQQHGADDRGFRVIHRIERSDMFSRNDQDMRRRLRVDVVEGDDFVVFIDFLRGDFARRDPAEKTAIVTHARIIR